MKLSKKSFSDLSERKKEQIMCYLMIALPLIGLVVLTAYPILWAIYTSFFSYNGIPSQTEFLGIKNYISLFHDVTYWKTWIVNLEFALIKVPIEMLLAFITANLLMRNTKFGGFYRAMYYLPGIISIAITGLIFSNLFDYFGVINAWLLKLGIITSPIEWFASKSASMTALMIGSFWASFGGSVIYFSAALSTVPKEIYESAEIDGAGKISIMFKITLPMIAPVLQVLLLLSISGVLNINEYILVMSNGAPAGKTHAVASYLTSKIVAGYGEVANIGYASAMSIVTSVIFCALGITFDKMSQKLQSIY